MPKQIIKVPASKTEQTIELDIPDTITASVTLDIPNQFPFSIKGTTPVDETHPTIPDPDDNFLWEQTAKEDWDNLFDLSPNQIGVKKANDSLAPYFSTSITKESPGAFKSIVPPGGNNLSSGNRSEQQYNDVAHNPVEGAVDYWAYYEDWDKVKSHQGHTFQIHPNGSGSAILSLQNYSGKYEVVKSLRGANTRIHFKSKQVESNKWIFHRWEYKLSTGSDGYVKFRVDGELICDYKGPTADGSGQYLKIGQNKWGSMPTASVVYYDNLSISKPYIKS